VTWNKLPRAPPPVKAPWNFVISKVIIVSPYLKNIKLSFKIIYIINNCT
jgi:maltose-binding protein MalE